MAYRFSSDMEYDKVGRCIVRKILPVLFVGMIVAVVLIPQPRKPFVDAITHTSQTLREHFFPSNPFAIEKIMARFVRDNHDSLLFLVGGQVHNRSKSPVACTMMMGKLFGTDGTVICQLNTYFGRRIQTDERRTFGAARIREMFERSNGGKITAKVQSGYSIPFMVVFYNLPEDAIEFEIEVSADSVSGEDVHRFPEKIEIISLLGGCTGSGNIHREGEQAGLSDSGCYPRSATSYQSAGKRISPSGSSGLQPTSPT